jgi:release factor glutamine methyltransferase
LIPFPASYAVALEALRLCFEKADFDNPALEARLVLSAAFDCTSLDLVLHWHSPLSAHQHHHLEDVLRRRLMGEPLARIIKEWEFWGLTFALSPATLIPRPDSETLIEQVLSSQAGQPLSGSILDLGTGSGCLLIALLVEWPEAIGIGIDQSVEAVSTAALNARKHIVAQRSLWVCSSWGDAVQGPFDVILSNPPYIPSNDIAGLAIGVRDHDPVAALDGGADGLDAYRALFRQCGALLKENGTLHLEIGAGQAKDVINLAHQAGFNCYDIRRDLLGHERALAFSKRHN